MKKQNTKMFRYILCLMLMVVTYILPSMVFAQQKNITGVVTNDSNKPIESATVVVKQTKATAVCDASGNFSIAAVSGQTLIISSVGYETKEVKVGNTINLSITLKTATNTNDEVVVIGYGTQKKKDLTGSISSLNITDAKKFSTNDISQLLQGRATGVAVNSDGQPGSIPSVRIRGFSTFGDSQPYYVVDGVPGSSIRDFSPNDIESISVLKDASAAAIYGAAAANGVVIITTKQGKKNTPLKVTYNGFVGNDKVWQIQKLTSRVDYQTLNNESRVNASKPLFPANDPTNPGFVKNIDTDWQKEGLKTGSRQNHNIALGGGGTNNTYNLSLDYYDQKGTYVGNGPDYKRYSARINTSADKGIFKFGQSFNYTHSKENLLTFRDDILLGGIPPLIGSLLNAIPTMPVYDAATLNGFGGSSDIFNGANSLNGIGINSILQNYVDVDRTFANVYGEAKILKYKGNNLKFKTSLSYDKTITRDYTWQPAYFLGNFFSNNTAKLSDNSRVLTNANIENTLNYDRVLGKHSIDALVGQAYRTGSSIFRESSAQGFTAPYYPTINNGTTRSAKGAEFYNALSSYFGRVNYGYADRYLLSASLRRDGSSRFAPTNKFGYFPAASVGWKVDKESFWHLPKSIISALKIRASYGKLGNQQFDDYQFIGFLNSGVVYTFNGVRTTGAIQTSAASPDVRWESKAITNVGFDATLLNGHFDVSAEYYSTKSTDVLLRITLPTSIGFTNNNPFVNAASLNNSGIEMNVGYHKTKGNFKLDVSANLSTVKNKVLSIGGGDEYLQGVAARTKVGRQVGEHYGYVYEGIFQSAAEIAAHATQFGLVLAPGDVKYKDISGPNGVPDGVVDAKYDRDFLGSGIPKYNYGLTIGANYKNFDATIVASGSAKFLINSRTYKDLHHSSGALNYSIDMLNRWTPTNTNTDIPRLNDNDANNFLDSDRPGWLQNGSYLRISVLSLGYNFKENIVKGLASARAYVTVQNLYSFQKYKSYNPDFTSGTLNPGFDFGSYPKPRSIMVGVQVTF
jgi:TonB-dependent starch-binding outer membrane protein SusC